ncbi:hypothetical protein [Enterobacter cancerogenus]|uniref:hypothetical protein n=1 Tax=Enterobacter cancerogenus TaxID=69218 RepID=UPI0020A6B813|nr:hypothetical protein [Enterobacter cancerogenus]
MSTITREFTKEQLIEKLQHRVAVTANYPDVEEAQFDAAIFRIALASLEAEPVGEFYHEARWGWYEISEGDSVPERSRIPLYRVPPAPVSEPEWTNEQCLEFLSIAFRHAEIKGDLELDDIRLGVKMVNNSRNAMFHGGNNDQ